MIYARDYLSEQKILGQMDGPAPAVSIILPTYSRCKNGMLERSIQSVLTQKFNDLELLVVDDGSIDGSSDLIETFRAQDPRVIHIRHEQNSGIHSIRLNEGIELSRGAYIGFQFDDDVLLPNAVGDLYSEITRHKEPVCVLGHSYFKGPNGEWDLPMVEINLVNLYEQNRFANNAILFPRELVNKYGMYDCHLGMRRLCDWDLWLRYIKHVPFIVIDKYITKVYESNPGSLGLTVPYDLDLFYYWHAIQRDHLLTPDTWQDYSIDSLKIGDVELEKDFRRRVYEEQIVPYYFRFRHLFPQVEGFSTTQNGTPKKTVFYTKQAYDTCNDVTLNNYDPITNHRGTYKSFYQPLSQVAKNWIREADLLILLRTVEDQGKSLVAEASQYKIPVGYYLDDDLLSFYEYGPQFSYLAPNTPYHDNLKKMIGDADAVLVTNSFIADSVLPLNPRVIPHNNSIPLEYLPTTLRPRKPGAPLKIGYVGQAYRIDEFKLIWDGLLAISHQYGDQVQFEFWGLDVSSLPPLNSPVKQRPFTFSYLAYLEALQKAEFDILLAPLLDHPRPRLGKSLIKYYETAVAGALGIFSDVPQYKSLLNGITCLKAKNTAEDWKLAIDQAITLSTDEFDRMRLRTITHVREEYTAQAQIHYHEAALQAIEFHGKTRAYRFEDGLPRVMYVFHSVYLGGAELQLWRRLHLNREYGIEPIAIFPGTTQSTEQAISIKQALEAEHIQVEFVDYVCYTEPRNPSEYFIEAQQIQIQALLEKYKPVLVHSVTFIPSFGQACTKLNIPHVSTQYAIVDSFEWPESQPEFAYCTVLHSDTIRYAKRWSELLGNCPKICARDMAPQEVFELGQHKYLSSLGSKRAEWPPKPISLVMTGTFQERKQQLETIKAVGLLVKKGFDCHLDFYGYTHYFPEYMQKCYQAIKEYGLQNRVSIKEFDINISRILEKEDVVLSLSTFESFPGSIKDAMAAGVLVVSTPVGGVTELIVDGISGIVCKDTSIHSLTEAIERAISLSGQQHSQIVEQARQVARQELHPHRAAYDNLMMYNLAYDLTYSSSSIAIQQSSLPRSDEKKPNLEYVDSPLFPSKSPVLVGAGINYEYIPKHNRWSGLGIFIGTHMRSVTGQLKLQIISGANMVVRETIVDITGIHDNDWCDIHFTPIENSQNKPFHLAFKYVNASPGMVISMYESNSRETKTVRGLRLAASKLNIPLRGNRLYSREWYRK